LTGLFNLAVHGKEIDVTESIMVGDRWRDIDAGNAFGLQCFFIDYGYSEQLPKPPYKTVDNLAGVVRLLRSIQVEGG
jgi:D-glycero-D-manno-heptose 1,7-bisphosphate phosphatase